MRGIRDHGYQRKIRMALNTKLLTPAATEARGLAMAAVQAASSRHLGLPLGDAEIGAVLVGHALHYYPDDPSWLGRARFALSVVDGCLMLYVWLDSAGVASYIL